MQTKRRKKARCERKLEAGVMRREAAVRQRWRAAYQECPASFGASFPSLIIGLRRTRRRQQYGWRSFACASVIARSKATKQSIADNQIEMAL
jgi:hypothetical protein